MHSFRIVLATLLYAAGWPFLQVAKVLGNSAAWLMPEDL